MFKFDFCTGLEFFQGLREKQGTGPIILDADSIPSTTDPTGCGFHMFFIIRETAIRDGTLHNQPRYPPFVVGIYWVYPLFNTVKKSTATGFLDLQGPRRIQDLLEDLHCGFDGMLLRRRTFG